VAPLIALSLLITGFIAWAHQSQAPPEMQRGLAAIVIAARAVCLHFAKLLIPHPLLLAYSREDNIPAWHWVYPLIVIAAAAALVLARNRLGRGVVAAALAYVALLLPPVLLSEFILDPQQYLARATPLIIAAAAGV